VNPLSLYPRVELPVSSATPMLSSLVQWDHSTSWEVPTVAEFLALSSGGSGSSSAGSVEVNVSSPDSEDAYLSGHVIDGRVLFPATGYLVLAWRQLARMNGQIYQQTPVCFDDVHIHRATILPATGTAELVFSMYIIFAYFCILNTQYVLKTAPSVALALLVYASNFACQKFNFTSVEPSVAQNSSRNLAVVCDACRKNVYKTTFLLFGFCPYSLNIWAVAF